jgi:F-type H+-transporting ATPase subunit epsilon
MADRLQLDITTPERGVLSEAVDAVTLPGLSGEIGILPGHTPLISQLQTGVLSYTQGTTTRRLHVSGGFVEVSDDRVAVLAELAERPEEIDAARKTIYPTPAHSSTARSRAFKLPATARPAKPASSNLQVGEGGSFETRVSIFRPHFYHHLFCFILATAIQMRYTPAR